MPSFDTFVQFLPNERRTDVARILKWGVTGSLTVGLDVFLFRTIYPQVGSVLLTNAIGFPITTSFNYVLHHNWSFKASRGHGAATPRYLVALGVNFAVNSLLVKVFLVAGATPTFAKLAAIPFQTPANFLLLNRWVFHSSESKAAHS